MEKYLGVDWGEKRIGLATADEEIGLALPLGTVANLTGLIQTITEEEITMLVVGRPYKIGGLEIKLSPDYLKFLELLKKQVTIPIFEIDERFSSKEADAMGGSKKMRAGRDAIAAALILQNYLDRYGRK
jgi:putative Holliday junction resolvase